MNTGCATISEESIQAALARLLKSRTFARSQQLQRILEVTVSHTLAGRESELKEYSIAVEACGRRPDHDPRIDAIVRTEARRLRHKLAKYYEEEGANEDVRIVYPKGSYVPSFEPNPNSGTVTREDETAGTRATTTPRVHVAVMAAAAAVIATVFFVLAGHAQIETATRIAVLAFQDLSQNRDHETLALATTESLIVRLTREPDLEVISDPIALTMATTESPGVVAGTTLSADYRLQGSVQRSGDRCRITAQLIRVDDERNIWAKSYTFDATSVFAVQDTVSEDVAVELRARMMMDEGSEASRHEPLARLGTELALE